MNTASLSYNGQFVLIIVYNVFHLSIGSPADCIDLEMVEWLQGLDIDQDTIDKVNPRGQIHFHLRLVVV